jgi:RNA polymerase sigma factor (sigma-70 family)
MGQDHRTDATLLEQTPSDPEAFAVFYRRHAPPVLAYLLYRTRDPERALDLTAETFAAALVSSHRYRAGKGPARGWLFGIAKKILAETRRREAAAERARRRLGIERLTFDDEDLDRVERTIDLERGELPLTALVGDLNPLERDAVLGRIVDEREYEDLAAEAGVTQHAMRQRVSRGLARIANWSRGSEHA